MFTKYRKKSRRRSIVSGSTTPVPHVVILEQQELIGGGQVIALELVQVYLSGGAKVTLACPGQGGLWTRARARFGRRVSLLGTPVPPQPDAEFKWLRGNSFKSANSRLAKVFSEVPGVDVLHVNGSRWFPSMFRVLQGLRPGKVIYHYHIAHSQSELRTLQRLLELGFDGTVLAASGFLYEHALAGLPDYLHGCVRMAENPMPYGYRDFRWWVRRPFRVGHLDVAVIGRICPEKGHGLLPALAHSLPMVQFHLVGEIEPQMQGFAQELKLACGDRVRFWPATSNVPHWVRDVGVSVSLIPSQWEEGFGLVFVESLAMSLITISARSGALAELGDRTGALAFSSLDELVGLLKGIAAMSESERVGVSQRQFEAARNAFSFDGYKRAVLNVAFRRIGPEAV